MEAIRFNLRASARFNYRMETLRNVLFGFSPQERFNYLAQPTSRRPVDECDDERGRFEMSSSNYERARKQIIGYYFVNVLCRYFVNILCRTIFS